MRPRLFSGLVAVESVLGMGFHEKGDHRNHRVAMMAKCRDRWLSREEARKALLRSPYYASFDSGFFRASWDLIL